MSNVPNVPDVSLRTSGDGRCSIPMNLGGDGVSYKIWIQERGYSCTASCFCSIVWLTRNKIYTEQFARTLIEVDSAKRQLDRLKVFSDVKETHKAIGKAVQTVDRNVRDRLTRGTLVEWDTAGERARVVVEALVGQTKLSHTNHAVGDLVPYLMELVSRKKPGLLGIMRPDEGHAVVVANKATQYYVILDPAAGLVLAEKLDIEVGSYSPWRLDASGTRLVKVGPEHMGDVISLDLLTYEG